MLKNIVLATVTVVALALVAYSIPAVPTVLAAGVELKTGLSDLVGATDSPELVLVKEGGEGKTGKGGKGHAKRGGHGDGGGKGHAKRGGHGDGDRDYARRGNQHRDGDRDYARRGNEHRDGDRDYARRGNQHRDGDRDYNRSRSVIVYRDGHRYWHDRRIWWWGPLVYSYDPCLRWVRFCPDCAPEQINICYDEAYPAYEAYEAYPAYEADPAYEAYED